MITHDEALEVIEQAQSAKPYCRCGRYTRLVDHDGMLWLECFAVEENCGRAPVSVSRLCNRQDCLPGVRCQERLDKRPEGIGLPGRVVAEVFFPRLFYLGLRIFRLRGLTEAHPSALWARMFSPFATK